MEWRQHGHNNLKDKRDSMQWQPMPDSEKDLTCIQQYSFTNNFNKEHFIPIIQNTCLLILTRLFISWQWQYSTIGKCHFTVLPDTIVELYLLNIHFMAESNQRPFFWIAFLHCVTYKLWCNGIYSQICWHTHICLSLETKYPYNTTSVWSFFACSYGLYKSKFVNNLYLYTR